MSLVAKVIAAIESIIKIRKFTFIAMNLALDGELRSISARSANCKVQIGYKMYGLNLRLGLGIRVSNVVKVMVRFKI